MPELAEVDYYRRVWDAGLGAPIVEVRVHAGKRIFRGTSVRALVRGLTGAVFAGSEARGKQMMFRFEPDAWLGLHLGMTGRLRVAPAQSSTVPARESGPPRPRARRLRGHDPASIVATRSEREPVRQPDVAEDPRHDHLVLVQAGRSLVFRDARLFGRVRFHSGPRPPEWWTELPPALLSDLFTTPALAEFLRRRARSPIKSVLLMQERFPGIGNWMADEILWRARLHPRRPAGSLGASEVRDLRREIRFVARVALRSISADGRDLPRGWLFHERWENGGVCPRTGASLVREAIGGRTACWSPARQPGRY